MMNKSCLLLLFCMLLLFSACSGKKKKDGSEKASPDLEQLVEINRELVIRENERIDSYILRKGLELETTGSGLRYGIVEKGDGDYPVEGSVISLEYTCSLLDGTLCYSSDEDGPMIIRLGSSDIPSGLDEALRLINEGSTAIVVLPSNMAYGLPGDGKRIPSRSPLVYKLKYSCK